MGLPNKVVVPIVTVFAVVFLGIMGYFLRIGLGSTGTAFGAQAVHEQGDARIAATPVPEAAPTQPPGTLDIPQSGTGPVAASGNAGADTAGPGAASAGSDGTPVRGGPPAAGGPPAPVMQLLTALKARVARNPRDIAALVQLGDLYFDAGKYDSAIGYFRRALALDPTNPDVRTDEAIAMHGTGHDLAALAEIDHVLAERRNFPPALFNKGVILRSMGRRTDAVTAYREFLAVAPHDAHDAEARSAIGELSQ